MGGFAAGAGAFGQGAMGGYQTMQAIRAKAMELQQHQMQLDDQKRQLAATAARYKGLSDGAPPVPAGQGGGQPPMGPGGPPQGMPPGQGGGQPPMGPGGPPPQGMPSGGQPPMGPGGPPPQGPPPGQGGAPVPLSGVAQPTGNPIQDMMKTWQSVAMDIKRRNPGIDDLTLGEAVEQQIHQLKELDPSEKAFLQAQTAYYKAGVDLMKGQGADAARMYSADKSAASRDYAADAGARSRENVAGTNAGARRYAADKGAQSRDYAADKGAESRDYAADAGERGRDYAADQSRAGRENSADTQARSAASKAYLTAVTQGGTVQPTPEQIAVAQQIAQGGARGGAATRTPASRPKAPQQASAPPANLLKEGQTTKFTNGQSWTLKAGKPVRVG